MRSKYTRWDGTQDPFRGDFDTADVLDAISDDLLSGLRPDTALRRLMRRGVRGASGLDDLRKRLSEMRRRAAENLNLEGPLNEIRDRLDRILERERAALSQDDGAEARMAETRMDMLPDSPAQAIRELMDYEWSDPIAGIEFRELVEEIQEQILNAYFGNLSGAIQSMTPEQVARVREMLSELNQMIEARDRGEPYDFEGFMERHGDFFPENPRNLDELLEVLARRMAAMSRLLASLSPEQRKQLQELAQSVMGDLDLAFEMDRLNQELRSLLPNLPWDEPALGLSEDPMTMDAALGAIDEMSELEELEHVLEGDYPGASIDDVDEDKLRRSLGEEAVGDLRRLKEIEKVLEETGVMVRNRGRLELTARGARRLGERALVKVFERIGKEREGQHEAAIAGGLAEPTGATRPWEFGDTGQIAVQRTVFNAILRDTAEAGDRLRGSPSAERPGLALRAEDFELVEAESRTRTATALLLDISFSMPLRGHWVPAKRMALALQALIEGKYPQDVLYLIGFSDYARRMEVTDLTAEGPIERVYGTNMQHAFLLARRLLSHHPRASKQVIMVTDGEPTAHLEPDGTALFNWPPVPETIHKTLAEAIRLSESGVTLNIFMQEDSPGLIRFMSDVAKRTGGRIFISADDELGDFVIRDYVRRR